ncbi:MAG: F0F1 ATP synthase subunit B [Chloroflexi bacterium]|nr:F0F1 ATP synthase subunit B [Chloroflexota bacterium]
MPLAANSLITVVPGLMIWTLVCFALVYLILKRFGFGKIQKIIDERRERIHRSIEQAEQARDEAARLLEEHRAILVQARGEAEEILENAGRVAESQRERLHGELESDRARRLAETERQIGAETQRALDQIKNEIAELTLITTAKVTGKLLTSEDHRRLIDSAVEEIDFSALEESRN